MGPCQDLAPLWVVGLLLSKITNANVSKCKAGRTQTNDENVPSRGVRLTRGSSGPGHSRQAGGVCPAHTSWPTSRHFSLAHVLAQLAFDTCLGPTQLSHTHATSVPQFPQAAIPNIVKNPREVERTIQRTPVKRPPPRCHRGSVPRLSVASRPVRVKAGSTQQRTWPQTAPDAPASRQPSLALLSHTHTRKPHSQGHFLPLLFLL